MKKIENTYLNGGKNFWGLGATLEGFGNNPVMYEFVLDKAWTKGKSMKTFCRNVCQNQIRKARR
jgi:alpha-N-acetylglucosaminidase